MKLLFDVGNSNISIAIIDKNDDFIFTSRIITNTNITTDELHFQIKNILDKNYNLIDKVLISSVVPNVTALLLKISTRFFKIKAFLIEPGVKTGINLKIDNPKEVGADLICALAAISSTRPTVVVDLGTASKYLYIDNKNFLGAIIAPGIALSKKALVNGTAFLPDFDLSVPKHVLGTNTITCMQSGITFGSSVTIDGLINLIEDEIQKKVDVILTGGLAKIVEPLLKRKVSRDPLLVFKGLNNIYLLNNK